MTPLDFVLAKEVRRYEADLDQWARRVATARSAEEALRAALRRPMPGGLTRGLPQLYRGKERACEHAVDQSLAALLDQVEDPAEAMACAQLARRAGPLPPAVRQWLRRGAARKTS